MSFQEDVFQDDVFQNDVFQMDEIGEEIALTERIFTNELAKKYRIYEWSIYTNFRVWEKTKFDKRFMK